jgi:hypothetical protein
MPIRYFGEHMGIGFRSYSGNNDLGERSNSRAHYFASMTNWISILHNEDRFGETPEGYITKKVIYYDTSDDKYVIRESVFIPLVETVYSKPSELLFGWAVMAAGYYEAIKMAAFEWTWPASLIPERNGAEAPADNVPVTPIRIREYSNKERITIGFKRSDIPIDMPTVNLEAFQRWLSATGREIAVEDDEPD